MIVSRCCVNNTIAPVVLGALLLMPFPGSVLIAGAPATEKAGTRLPAFPGAEGFGAFARGGRGGRIIEVTNLNTSGPGSLRAACKAKGPRIVVFRVSGIINHGLGIAEPFITIAGQTAPGDGICLRNYDVNVSTHHVIIRHIRVRTGDHPFGKYGSDRRCIVVGHGPPGACHDVIVDHCSFSWGTDQNLNASNEARNVTYQWCITSEALYDSIHPKGPHSMATLLGGRDATLSLHHCLLAHNMGRNPLIAHRKHISPTVCDFRNNVMYKHGGVPFSQMLGHPHVNYVGNFIKLGMTGGKRRPYLRGIHHYNPYDKKYGPARLYVKDNVWPGNPKGERDDWEILEPVVKGKKRPALGFGRLPGGFARLPEPIPVPPVTTESPAQAYENVLKFVGCTRPVRDVVDARIVAEVRAGTGRIIDSQEDVGGYPTYASTTPPADSDHDAMPDAWERRYGFNPNDSADGPKDRDGDGYTNVEEYLNQTDPTKPDTGVPVPQAPVKVQAGNERIRGEAGRKRGEDRLARLKTVNATEESRKALLKKVRESGKEVADVLDIKFVKIPPGEIMMGKVKVILTRPFELSSCEITQAQWEAVMGTRPWSGQVAAKDDPKCPATYVNYLDCQEFIRRLNACGGRKYRLPTTSEWRHAVRGGTNFPYGFKDWKRAHESAWCFARFYNEKGRMVGKRVPKAPQAVGQLKPNPWGLYDMAGNASEWCHDWFSSWTYRPGPARTDPMGPKTGTFRRHCGGHFVDHQVVFAWRLSPMHRPYYRGFGMGFRLHRALIDN